MLPAIVLAAGASTRMGTPKPLLADPDGRSFVERVVGTLLAAGLTDVVVVTGSSHPFVEVVLEDAGLLRRPRLIRNPDPGAGQLSSLLAGLDAIPEASEGVLVTLVDVPMVSAATVRAVISAWLDRRAPIVRPAIGDRHGHPVIFDRRVFAALRAAPLDEGAKRVVRDHEVALENVPVADEGCLMDVDTPDDYRRLIRAT
jgi:molybdenum cofactor cytidylyltransferase